MSELKTSMNASVRAAGVTLIELLIAMAIFMLLLGIVTAGLQQGGRVVSQLVTQSAILEDARTAGAMIADGLTNAVYVFPPGVSLTMTATGYTTQNPVTGGASWTIGDHPIIAYIERSSSGGNLTFVAYYALDRGDVTSHAGKSYLADPANDDSSWMLYEYRKGLTGLSSLVGEDVPTDFGGNSGRILADYIAEGGFGLVPGTLKCNNEDGVRQPDCSGASTTPTTYETLRAGQFFLQTEVKRRGRVISGPGLTFAVAPRSLYNYLLQ